MLAMKFFNDLKMTTLHCHIKKKYGTYDNPAYGKRPYNAPCNAEASASFNGM
jgi:hypothetical protein